MADFPILCNGAQTIHSRGGSCTACQAGYPLTLREPPMVTIGFKAPASEVVMSANRHPNAAPGHPHVEPRPAEPILERDPLYPMDEHATRCPGLLHGVLKEDTIQYHSYLEVCEMPGCTHVAIRKFPHTVT